MIAAHQEVLVVDMLRIEARLPARTTIDGDAVENAVIDAFNDNVIDAIDACGGESISFHIVCPSLLAAQDHRVRIP